MALSINALFSARADGNNANGGGFNPASAGFATDLTATSATGNSPVVSSASYSFVAGDVGAWLFIKSGTNWTPGFYQIASVSAGSATLSAAVGAGRLYSGAVPGYSLGLSTIAGVATVASPTGGTWGIDYSLSAAARIAFTDLVIGATTTQFTSAANPVGKNFVGNHIQIVSGTGFTVGLYEIVSTTGTTATCDRSLGTAASTGGVGNLGGAYASPGLASNNFITGGTSSNLLRIKPGTYSISSATPGAAGGPVILMNSSFFLPACYIGCDVLPGDTTSRPILQATVGTLSILSRNAVAVGNGIIDNLEIDGNSQTSVRGIELWTTQTVRNCKVRRCTNFGIWGLAGSTAYNLIYSCEICECTTTGYGVQTYGHLAYCYIHDNTVPGAAATTARRCIFDTNTGIGFTVQSGTTINLISECVAYGNTGNGFHNTSAADAALMIDNCISYGNGGWAIGGDRNSGGILIIDLAAGSNTSGRIQRVYPPETGAVTLSASPFVDGPGGNFALNTTAGGGALCRAAGFPSLFPGGLTANYLDIGAAQHQDAGGGGGTVISGGFRGGYDG